MRAGREGAWQEQRPAEEVTDAVIAYLDETGIPDHLFLFTHYFDPHTPYSAPAPFDTTYDPRGRSDLPSVDFFKGRQELQYAAEITYMDHHMGRLLDYLRGRALLNDALDLGKLDEETSHRPRFGQASKPWDQVETDPSWANMAKPRCIRDGSFKFIQSSYQGVEELYNVEHDPNEITNLLQHASRETAELADRLRRRLEVWDASADPLPSQFEPSQTQDTVRRLRSLGYLR